MIKTKTTPQEIWKEYQDGVSYKTTIDLYDNVKMNQNFYLGKQWEGVNAPDIEKPVLNVCKQWVDYAVSMLVSDDIGIKVKMPDYLQDATRKVLEGIVNNELNKVIENTKFKTKTRAFIKNCSIDGDAFYHWWYNTEKRTDQPIVGDIDVEILDNTNVIFGDPAEPTTEGQPYIIIVSKLPTDRVKDLAGDASDINDDTEDYNQQEMDARSTNKYTTVLTKLWRQEGSVHYIKTTQKVVLTPDTDLQCKLYPIVKMSWKVQKNSYHGISPLTEIRPNQIMINKFFMMLNEFVKKMSFPKMLYDMTKISSWSNKPEAIGVNGDPREAIAVSSPTAQISQQIIQYSENLIEKTKSVLGIYDVSLGNVRPENTSAIIALQKTASQPLELQKLDYYQTVEDSVHIMMDLMASFYGSRDVKFDTESSQDNMMKFDFSDLRDSSIGIEVEIGTSAYWSEITQIQTLDNMYRAGIIPDPITYLEQLPSGIIASTQDIIDAIYKKQQQEMMAQQAMGQGVPNMGQPQPNSGQSGLPQNISQPKYMGGSNMGITSNNNQDIVV